MGWAMSDDATIKGVVWIAFLCFIVSESFFVVFFDVYYLCHDVKMKKQNIYQNIFTAIRHTLMFVWLLPMQLVSKTPAEDCFNYEPQIGVTLPVLQILTYFWMACFWVAFVCICVLACAYWQVVTDDDDDDDIDVCDGLLVFSGCCGGFTVLVLMAVSITFGLLVSLVEMFTGSVPVQESPSTIVLLALWAAYTSNTEEESKSKSDSSNNGEAKV